MIKHLTCLSFTAVSQGYQVIDVRKFFIENFQLIDTEGMLEYHSFATLTEII